MGFSSSDVARPSHSITHRAGRRRTECGVGEARCRCSLLVGFVDGGGGAGGGGAGGAISHCCGCAVFWVFGGWVGLGGEEGGFGGRVMEWVM